MSKLHEQGPPVLSVLNCNVFVLSSLYIVKSCGKLLVLYKCYILIIIVSRDPSYNLHAPVVNQSCSPACHVISENAIVSRWCLLARQYRQRIWGGSSVPIASKARLRATDALSTTKKIFSLESPLKDIL